MSQSSEVISAVAAALQKVPSVEMDDAERLKLLQTIDELRAAVEPPVVALQRICFAHHGITTIRIAIGMGLFNALAAAGGAELTLDELDLKTKGDKVLLLRIMRLLCIHKLCKETSKDTYQALPLAGMFVDGAPPADAIKHFYLNMRVSANLFDFFEKSDYQTPNDAFESPFQFAHSTKEHYFEWLSKRPADFQAFNSVMTMGRHFRGEEWFEYFPVSEKLHVSSSDRVALTDIGGGVGHDIVALKQRFPDLPGRLILQDLPQVIDDIRDPLPEGVEALGHSMFEPQPVKGAKAYYLRTVLHDWPDKQALEVLARVREVMAEDSVLLLNENTLPETNVPSFSAGVDLTMMENFSSLERTEKQWVELLEKAEFRVVKVWRTSLQAVGSNALFEATL